MDADKAFRVQRRRKRRSTMTPARTPPTAKRIMRSSLTKGMLPHQPTNPSRIGKINPIMTAKKSRSILERSALRVVYPDLFFGFFM
jgi:hypothetical protein